MSYRVSRSKGFGFFIYQHSGVIQKKDLKAAWLEILDHAEFTHGQYNVLADIREGSFDFTVEELDVMMNFLASIRNLLDGRRMAIIVDKPRETVISMLLEKPALQEFGFHIKTFATMEAAVEFARINPNPCVSERATSNQSSDYHK